MGAWGYESFENDSALDWVAELARSDNHSILTSALAALLTTDDYIDVDESSAAIAAAEVVAALKGHPHPTVPDAVSTWVQAHPLALDRDLQEQAIQAILRVEQESELQELWAESEDYEQWKSSLQNLRSRLEA
jgi:hypothetical protein